MKSSSKKKAIVGDVHIPFHSICSETKESLLNLVQCEPVVLEGDKMDTTPVLPIGKANKPFGPLKTKE